MTEPATGGDWSYRPHLDGLRAVAVYLVVAFHAGIGRASGGFIGVDVFFVLSGYLVTGVLVRDLGRHGRVRLARFYSRRVRRLLPAAVVTLLVSLVVYAAVADPVAVDGARSATRAAFLYVANWFFVRRSADYFATDVNANPVLHFWSLAVEEQFYLVWPLLLTGLFLVARRLPGSATRWVQAAVVGGGLVSLGLALHWRASALDRAYFGTDTRAYQLLAGAFLALTPGLIRRLGRLGAVAGVVAAGSLAGLIVIGSSVWATGPIVRGAATAVLTCGLIAGTEAASGVVRRVLSLSPIVYLGRISYGIYLWHWPVIVVVELVRPMSHRSLLAVAAVLGTALAALSFELIEQPVRTWRPLDLRPSLVAMSGIVTGLIAAGLLVPALPDADAGPSRSAAATVDPSLAARLTPVPAGFVYGKVWFDVPPEWPDCVGKPLSACTFHRGSGPRIVVLGDSTMHALSPAFVEMAERHDLTLTMGTRPGCPWPEGFYLFRGEGDILERCQRLKEDLYDRVLPGLRPDLIIAMDAGPDPDTDVTKPTPPGRGREYHDAVLASVPKLASFAAHVVLLDPLPKSSASRDPAKCLRTARYTEACRFRANAAPTWMEVLDRQAVERADNVEVLDIDRLACPLLPLCDPVVGGRYVWRDSQHLTQAYGRSLGEPLYQQLVSAGALPG